MQRLEIWLSPPDRTALGLLADQCGLTQSALARMVLKSALAHPAALLPGLVRLPENGGMERPHA
jgi:hypothetical protein